MQLRLISGFEVTKAFEYYQNENVNIHAIDKSISFFLAQMKISFTWVLDPGVVKRLKIKRINR